MSSKRSDFTPPDPGSHSKPDLLLGCASTIEMQALRGVVTVRRASRSAENMHGNAPLLGDFQGWPLWVARLGVGPDRFADSLERWIDRCRPGQFILFGFSGSLNPQRKLGDVLAGAEFLRAGLDLPSAPARFEALPRSSDKLIDGLPAAKLLTTPRPVLHPHEKRRLGETTGADAVDLESADAVDICSRKGVAVAIIRAISDEVDDSLDSRLVSLLNPDGSTSIVKSAGALLQRPWLIPQAMRLHRQSRVAGDGLRRAVAHILRQWRQRR